MKREEILEKYRLAFSNDPLEPITLFGLEIGDGWLPLIENLCKLLYKKVNRQNHDIKYYKDILEKNNYHNFTTKEDLESKIALAEKLLEEAINEMPKFQQIKEKFGTLRIYTSHLNLYIDGAIDMAESMSEHICEKCGDKGQLYEKGWHRTLCFKHAEELKYI
jgi:hypothetical protein